MTSYPGLVPTIEISHFIDGSLLLQLEAEKVRVIRLMRMGHGQMEPMEAISQRNVSPFILFMVNDTSLFSWVESQMKYRNCHS
jgi:hypothetical protein